jgi:ribose/xylose/arabinose/galactoside ABC-type transport system permease subunit
MKKLRLERNDIGLIPIVVFLIVLMAILSDKFLTLSNVMQIFQQMSELGVLAIGGTVVIMTAAIDVSVTAVSALTGIVIGAAFQAGLGFGAAIGMGFAAAVCAGLLNGFLVGVLKINSILATLGTKSVFTGLRSSSARAWRSRRFLRSITR